MRFKWRKWNLIIHRDLGYLFWGMTVIYAISGLALNHLKDWNPNYEVDSRNVQWEATTDEATLSKNDVLAFLDKHGEKVNYKKYYFPEPGQLKIFLKSGSVMVDLENREAKIEKLTRRPIFYEFNYLHYNPGRLWTWFADIFSIALLILAISGLFVIRGKKGITGRGAWLTGIGVVVPLVLLLSYLN